MNTDTDTHTDTDTTPSVPADPIAQMEVAFDGNPSKREIQAALDSALTATNTPITAESYSRAGSVLVSFKNQYGSNEMDLLACIPTHVDDPRAPSLTFPNVAAVCNVDMVQGDWP